MYNLLSVLSVLIIISTVPIVSAEVIRGESTVPDWVKNTAGWWASEQIPDSAFLQGIQYLLKEGIMIVEIPTEIDSEAAEEGGNDINEYTLTTAWDVSTASFVDSFSINSQEAAVRDVWFDSSGKTMFIVGKSGDDVNVYKLNVAWDVSSASHVS